MNNEISRDEKLRNKRKKGIIGFHKFIMKYKPNQNTPYCFVEGEDSKYYFPRMLIYCRNEPEFIRCDGKKGVIDAFKEISKFEDYNFNRLFFFVDKDFDNSIENEHIYETPCYAVENLYTTPRVLERILKSEFNLDDTDYEFNSVMATFIEKQNQFHDNISLLNAWILHYKQYMSKSGEEIKLRLNNLSFKDHLFDVTLDEITCKYNIEKIEEILDLPRRFTTLELQDRYNEMQNLPNRGKVFRGKFEIAFFKQFLDKIVEDANKKNGRKIFKTKKKVRLLLDVNILTVLSAYAETPECLIDYINKKISGDFTQSA